ncbi:sugar transporter, partial [Erwinia amylovora]|nr:sugar transporter [Erwinia amylovora]
NKFPATFFIGAIALITLSMMSLYVAPTHKIAFSTLCIGWGMAVMVMGLAVQVRVLALAPDASDVAMSLLSGIYNIGIGAGALLGGQVSLNLNMSSVGYVGGAIG